MTTIIPTPAPVPNPLSSDFGTKAYDFTVWMSQAAPAMQAVGEEINAALNNSLLGVTSSSTTSLLIGTGSKTLTVSTGLGYALGMPLKLASSANVSNYMKGVVTAYNSGTGSLTVNVASVGGSGTFADWSVFFDVPDYTAPRIYGRTITSTETLRLDDTGKRITANGTLTLNLGTAATYGDGWNILLTVDSGLVTLAASGAETIDGVSSGVINGTWLLTCKNGTTFSIYRIGAMANRVMLTSGTSWTATLGAKIVKLRMVGSGSGVNAATSYTPFAGGYCEKLLNLVPGTAYSYTIGAGTTGGGSPSTFTAGSLIRAAGGNISAAIPVGGYESIGGDLNINAASFNNCPAHSRLGNGGFANLGTIAPGYGGGVLATSTETMSGGQGVIILEY